MSNVTNHHLSVVTVFVQDCQLLDFLVNTLIPFGLFFWVATLFCRARQSRYEEVTKCSPVEVNAVPVEVRTKQ